MTRQATLTFTLALALLGANASASDLKGDGRIDTADLDIMRAAFQEYDSRADLNADGRINFADLALLKAAQEGRVGTSVDGGVTPTMTLLPATSDVPFYNSVVLELWMDFSAEPTLGGGTDIHFDPEAIKYLSFEFDPGLADDPAFRRVPDLTAPGELNALAFGSFDGLTGPALVGRFTFRAQTTLGASPITMDPDEPDGMAGPFVSAITFVEMAVNFIGDTINVVNGPLPSISATPDPVNFGIVRVNNVRNRPVLVSNTGDLGLIIGQIGAGDPLSAPFSISTDNCSSRTLLPGNSCSLELTMVPVNLGTFNNHFSIPSNDPVTPATIVDVTGAGVAPIGMNVNVALNAGRCENVTSGQVVAFQGSGVAFDCEGRGLTAVPKDALSVTAQGTPQSVTSVGGATRGMTLARVDCNNQTTGQHVQITPTGGQSNWNCVAAGLTVSNGDQILMTAHGRAY